MTSMTKEKWMSSVVYEFFSFDGAGDMEVNVSYLSLCSFINDLIF